MNKTLTIYIYMYGQWKKCRPFRLSLQLPGAAFRFSVHIGVANGITRNADAFPPLWGKCICVRRLIQWWHAGNSFAAHAANKFAAFLLWPGWGNLVTGFKSQFTIKSEQTWADWTHWTLSLSIYIYGTLTPSHKSGKKWGKVPGPYAVCRSACIMYTYVTWNM